MQVARVQIDEWATPLLALRESGRLYDVQRLEAVWGIQHPFSDRDFHTRVVAARGEGLDELAARLAATTKPAAARLDEGSYVPMPPCDVERASYLQLPPVDRASPGWQHRDARSLVGHEQPAAVFGDALGVEVGLAAVLGEDLWQAAPRDVDRALVGVTLVLDWHGGREGAPLSPSHLGPDLVLRRKLRDLARLPLRLEVAGRRRDCAPMSDEALPAALDRIAYVSHHVPLRAGDVIGLGALEGGRVAPMRFGDRVVATLHPLMRLVGWATPAPTVGGWR